MQAVDTGLFEADDVAHHGLGAADQLDIAAHITLGRLVAAPGMGIAGFTGMALQRTGVACGGDRGVDFPGFGIAVPANHQRVDQGAHLTAIATGGVFDALQMLGQFLQRVFDLGTAGAGGEHNVGMPCREVDTGG